MSLARRKKATAFTLVGVIGAMVGSSPIKGLISAALGLLLSVRMRQFQ